MELNGQVLFPDDFCSPLSFFPLPFFSLDGMATSSLTGHESNKARAIYIANRSIHSLNQLWIDTRPSKVDQYHGSLTPSQSKALGYIMRLTLRFIKENQVAQEILAKDDISMLKYAPMGFKGDWVRLSAERVALPAAGEGATVQLQDVLPTDVFLFYNQPNMLLKDQPPTEKELAKIPVVLGVKKGHYPSIISKMVTAGMVRLQAQKPKVINGMFGVKKDELKDRVIFDGRRCNSFFKPPQDIQLPNPALFQNLWIEEEEASVYIGKTDVSNMFHRFRVPEWMSQYFGLPEMILEDGTSFWPVLVSLPMGFCHSVGIASQAHQHTVKGALNPNVTSIQLITPQIIRLSHPFSARPLVWLSYIDDECLIALLKDIVNEAVDLSTEALNNKGLRVQNVKNVRASEQQTTDVLGTTFSHDGYVTPKIEAMAKLINLTLFFLNKRKIAPKKMAALLGHWTWFFLLRRPYLCLFQEVYELSDVSLQGSQEITTNVASELRHVIELAPLLQVNLRTSPSPIIIASDASLQGGGVCVADISVGDFCDIARLAFAKGWIAQLHLTTNVSNATTGAQHTPPHIQTHNQTASSNQHNTQQQARNQPLFSSFLPNDQDPPIPTNYKEQIHVHVANRNWTTVISTKWKFTDNIAILEMQALFLAIKWLTNNRASRDIRQVFLIDSMAVLGCLLKGRSSCRRLNHLCRRIFTLLTVCNIMPIWLWIPSEMNPADKPSRSF